MRRFLIITTLLILLAAGGLSAYWFIARDILEQGIDDWAAESRAQGWQLAYDGPATSGFPLRLLTHFKGPDITLPDGSRWQGPDFEAYAWLWDLETIMAEGAGQHSFAFQEQRVTLGHGPSRLTLGFAQGLLEHLALALVEPQLTGAGDSLIAKSLTLTAGPLLPQAGADFAITFEGQLQGFQLPPSAAETSALLGPLLEELHLVGELRGPLIGRSAPEMATRWRDGGGILDLSTIALTWGDLTITGEGSVSLDEKNRLLGAFTLETVGLIELLDRLIAEGRLTQEATTLRDLLVLGATRTDDGHLKVGFPVTLQDGLLYVGPAPIGQLRALF